ncbi:hypothetical protein BO83DRAFT_387306 [Aspergillus eucalypticola CBS 122712]|uniref:Uncharacterized protein n=1 Tax=Aspergillus eucalypticola (strain CBS 122712 / IBT 29274) TaxID=1448314 RepID=A0A317VUD6_ASPEC|nr:uncharacterized protein BO83DRAFT_387306 [Aspergillus eucalypticola CBS 122712]PWY76637.1 hypothetical protein BO83DRAFT_387306 [Aspergillus eucalypticola CBS 122712]
MTQLVVHWFACNHFYPEWRNTPIPPWASPGTILRPTAALHGYDCSVCLDPPSKIQEARKSVLMTATALSKIIDIPVNDGGFMHGVIRFYARGDHLRWLQPPTPDAQLLAPDPYLHALMMESWRNTLGELYFWTRPGYLFDVALAEVKRSEPDNYELLNWSGTNYMPICPYYYVSMPPMAQPVAKPVQSSYDSAQRSSLRSQASSNLVQTPMRKPDSSVDSTQSSFDTARTASSDQSLSSRVSQSPCHEDIIQQVGTQNNTTTAMQNVQTSQVSLPFVRMDPSVALDDPFVVEPISVSPNSYIQMVPSLTVWQGEGSWSRQDDHIADLMRQLRLPGPMVRNVSPDLGSPTPSTPERISARVVNRSRDSEKPYKPTSLANGTSASCDDDETWSMEDASESSFKNAANARSESAASSAGSPVVASENDNNQRSPVCNTSDTPPIRCTTVDPSLLVLENSLKMYPSIEPTYDAAAIRPRSLSPAENPEHELQVGSPGGKDAEDTDSLTFNIGTENDCNTDLFTATLDQYTVEQLAARQLTKTPELEESNPNEYGFGFGFQHSLFDGFDFLLPEEQSEIPLESNLMF